LGQLPPVSKSKWGLERSEVRAKQLKPLNASEKLGTGMEKNVKKSTEYTNPSKLEPLSQEV